VDKLKPGPKKQTKAPKTKADGTTDKRSNGRKNKLVLESFTVKQRQSLWSKHVINHEGPRKYRLKKNKTCSSCWIWLGGQMGGYGNIVRGHATAGVKVHQLAAWVRFNELPTNATVVSHRCHRKLCINPHHLVLETRGENNARIGCLAYYYEESTETYTRVCHHEPHCLRTDKDNRNGFELEEVDYVDMMQDDSSEDYETIFPPE
jgi:hypothetical protein